MGISSNTAARLYIDVDADIKSAMANMRTIDQQVNRAADTVKRTNPILQGLGQGLGLAGVASAALATKAVVDLAKGTINAASDLREAVTLTDQVFEANSAEMQRWAAGAADTFGQSRREALDFASGFGTLFKNVGMSLDEVGDKSRSLTRLAADLGSTFNRSAGEVAIALRAGLVGEVEPTRRLGIFLNETAVSAMAVKLGIARVGQQLSDTQKVAARYAIIMKDSADSQGMFGRDTESLADAQKRLATNMENLAAAAGQMVMPALVDITNFLNTEGVPALENEIAGVEKLATRMGELAAEIRPAIDQIERLNFIDPKPVSEGVGPGLTDLVGQALGLQGEWARTMDNMAFSAAYMAHASRENLDSLERPLRGVGDQAHAMAVRVVRSNADVIASYDAMRKRMTDAASGAGQAIYGPLIAAGQLAATEREMAAQREIIASGRSSAAQISNAGAAGKAATDAIAAQIDAITELERVADRAFAKRMGQYGAEIAAQLGLLDSEEQARRIAKRDASLAEQIARAQADLASAGQPNADGVTDPAAVAAAQGRLNDLLAQQEENRLSDAANARRQELREVQKQLDAIVAHEREAMDTRTALAEAHANAAAIAGQIAAAREMGDLQRVADLGLVLEAQKAEIARLALEARHKDRQADLEREKTQLEERGRAVSAAGASEVADAKQRLAELAKIRLEQLALLASYGDRLALEMLLASQELHKSLQEGTDEQIANILALMRQLNLLKLTALEAAGALNFTSGGAAQGDRVPGVGGAYARGTPWVPEDQFAYLHKGEAVIPAEVNAAMQRGDGRNEMYVPESAAGGDYGAAGGSGGGTSGGGGINLNVTVSGAAIFDPYGSAAQQIAQALMPGIQRELGRQGVSLA